MFNFFFKKSKAKVIFDFPVDIHSHLIPGIDDGSKSNQDSLSILRSMRACGFKRWITTPHIFQEFYKNDLSSIKTSFELLQEFLVGEGEEYNISFAAEYYLDEHLIRWVMEKNALTLPGDYLLFETSMISEPFELDSFIFSAGLNGYKPVMAHPERYAYLAGRFEKIEQLRDKGVFLQVNLLSFLGYYSNPVKKMARELADLGWIDFVGSDCHNQYQAGLLKDVCSDRYFKKVVSSDLMNYKI